MHASLQVDDPAFDWISLQIDWSDESGLFADESKRGSALRYLKQVGETDRYEKLKLCKTVLQDIFDTKPNGSQYVLQGVTGLSSLKEAYDKLAEPVDIQLQCLESVRWRIRGINAMLSYVMYDPVRQLHVLPRNLRRFSGVFVIADVRDLSSIAADGSIVAEGEEKPLMFSNANGTQLTTLACSSMYFVPMHVQDDVSNVVSEPASGMLAVQVWHCVASTCTPALEAAFAEATEQQSSALPTPLTKLQRISEVIKAHAAQTVTRALAVAKQNATRYSMARGYAELENAGFVDKVNRINKLTKPDYLAAQFSDVVEDLLDKKLGRSVKQVADSIYRDDLGVVEHIETEDTTYKQDLGNDGDLEAYKAMLQGSQYKKQTEL